MLCRARRVTSSLRRSLPESAVAAALFVACFVAVHYWFWGRLQIVDWPGVPELRPRHRRPRSRAVPRLRRRVPARVRCPCSSSRRLLGLRDGPRGADGRLRRRADGRRRRDRQAGRLLRGAWRPFSSARSCSRASTSGPTCSSCSRCSACSRAARRSAGRSSAPPSARSSGRSCSCRSRSSGRSATAAGARRSWGLARGARDLRPVRDPRAARALGERPRPGRPAAADREPRRVAPRRVRRTRRSSRATARRTSPGTAPAPPSSPLMQLCAVAVVLGRVRARPGDAEPAPPLLGRRRLRVRRVRQGALAAVPALADPARAARRRRRGGCRHSSC